MRWDTVKFTSDDITEDMLEQLTCCEIHEKVVMVLEKMISSGLLRSTQLFHIPYELDLLLLRSLISEIVDVSISLEVLCAEQMHGIP